MQTHVPLSLRASTMTLLNASSTDSSGCRFHRPSALGLLLLRRRALEVLRSVHVHEPSSLLTFDLMDISMWVSMDISMWMSIEMSIEMSMRVSMDTRMEMSI